MEFIAKVLALLLSYYLLRGLINFVMRKLQLPSVKEFGATKMHQSGRYVGGIESVPPPLGDSRVAYGGDSIFLFKCFALKPVARIAMKDIIDIEAIDATMIEERRSATSTVSYLVRGKALQKRTVLHYTTIHLADGAKRWSIDFEFRAGSGNAMGHSIKLRNVLKTAWEEQKQSKKII